MFWRRTALLIALLATPALCACKGDSRRELSAQEVKALFAEKTVEGHHDVHGYDFRSYYEKDGTYRSYQNGSKTPRKARWWVLDDGKICVRWSDRPRDLCRTMVTDDKGNYWKIYKIRGRRKAIVTFASFTPGNPHKL